MTEYIVQQLVANAPLVVALGVLYIAVTPHLIKSTLQNGGGEIVKRIVREANAEQSKETAEAFAKVRERLAAVETHIKEKP